MRKGFCAIGFGLYIGSALAADGFDLHCPGSGVHKENETATISSYGKKDGRQTSTVQQSTMREFEGSVDVKIGMGMARIRVPHQFIPAISAGKDDGWLDLHDLNITDREITGQIHFNFANKPKVRIDRIAGDINIAGGLGGEFNGTCQLIDETTERAF